MHPQHLHHRHHHHHIHPHHGIPFIINRSRWGGLLVIIFLVAIVWTLRRRNTFLIDSTYDSDEPTDSEVLQGDNVAKVLKSSSESSSSIDSLDKEANNDGNTTNKVIQTLKSNSRTNNINVLPSYTHTIPSLYALYQYLIRLDLFVDSALGSFIFMNACFFATVGLTMLLEKALFGSLRSTERRVVMEKCMTLVFYHVLFLFGICSVESFEDLLFWITWFLLQALLQHFTVLGMERLKFVLTSMAGNGGAAGAAVLGGNDLTGGNLNNGRFRGNVFTFFCSSPGLLILSLSAVLLSLQAAAGGLIAFLIYFSTFLPWNVLCFLSSHLLFLVLHNAHSLLRLFIYLFLGINTSSTYSTLFSQDTSWFYYTSLTLEMAAVIVDIIHYCLMLVWTQHYITVAALVVLFHLRHLCQDLTSKWKKHKSFMLLRQRIRDCFPLIVKNGEDENGTHRGGETSHDSSFPEEETCAICWDLLTVARRLPCKHEFHEGCLLSWLVQDLSCPVCRRSLGPELRNTQGGRLSHSIGNNQMVFGGIGPALPEGVLPPNFVIPNRNVTSVTNARLVIGLGGSSRIRTEEIPSGGIGSESGNSSVPSAETSSDSRNAIMPAGSPSNNTPTTEGPEASTRENTNFTTFYQFNGARYCRWLPSITLEIARFQSPQQVFDNDSLHQQGSGTNQTEGGEGRNAGSNGMASESIISTLVHDADVQQLQELFPNMSRYRLQQILLHQDGSLEDAIESILDGGVLEEEHEWDILNTNVNETESPEDTALGNASTSDAVIPPAIEEGQASKPENRLVEEVVSSPCSQPSGSDSSFVNDLPSLKASNFSSNSTLRESSFRERKEIMLATARERYLKFSEDKKHQ